MGPSLGYRGFGSAEVSLGGGGAYIAVDTLGPKRVQIHTLDRIHSYSYSIIYIHHILLFFHFNQGPFQPGMRSRSRRSRHILVGAGAGAGAAETVCSEPEP